jgi:hypothetical protein
VLYSLLIEVERKHVHVQKYTQYTAKEEKKVFSFFILPTTKSKKHKKKCERKKERVRVNHEYFSA